MKKFFMCCALMAAVSGGAMAQYQLTNNDFEGNWEACYPWSSGSYSSSDQGTQPEGWCIANVRGMNGLGATTVGKEGPGRSNDGKSVVLTNTPNPLSSSQIVPGYMTLGTAWATAKASISGSVTSGTADGGAWGGINFTFHPDAIHLYYKRAHKIDNTSVENINEKASIIAYSWRGTWIQKDVPTNTYMNIGGKPSYIDMENRDRNVLFNAKGTVGGDITAQGELISSLEYYIEGNASEWTELTIPFTYKTSALPEKLNIIIAADDFFADRSNIGGYNQLTVDDITLLYYSELTSGSFNGTPLTINANGTIEDVKDIYSEDKISLTSNGHGATIEKSYDEETTKLTVTVKGEDISENASNFHTYTIQFAKKGDVNGDGEVTIADVTALVNIILGKNDKKAIADVNGDDDVTIADVTALVNIILGK